MPVLISTSELTWSRRGLAFLGISVVLAAAGCGTGGVEIPISSNAIGGNALTGCQQVSGGSSGVAGEGTRPRNVDAMVRVPGTRLGSENTASCSR